MNARVLILNTVATYIRLILSAVIGLVIVRFLILEVGLENYGLFAALTAATALFGFLQSALVAGSVRHLSVELGRPDYSKAGSVFKSSFVLFFLASIGILLVGGLGSEFFIRVIAVPSGQVKMAYSLYWLSLLSLSLQVLSMPYRAVLQARQLIVKLSIFDLMDKVARLAVIGVLFVFPFSALVNYMIFNLIISFIFLMGVGIYCSKVFHECRIWAHLFKVEELRAMAQFSFWVVFESAATALREHGSIVLLSSFFNSVIAAAYDVATRLCNQIVSVASAFANVIVPAMATYEGKEDFRRVVELGNMTGRYCFFASSFVFIPIVFETNSVLLLWLDKVPSGAADFVKLIIAIRLISLISWGDALIARSKARMALLSLFMTLPYFLAFLAAFIWFKFKGGSPFILPWSMLIVSGWTGFFVRPWYVRHKILKQSFWNFIHDVCWPVFRVILPAILGAYAIHLLLEPGLWRLVAVSLVYFFISSALIFLWGMSALERETWRKIISQEMRRGV